MYRSALFLDHQPVAWYKFPKYSENRAGENLNRIGLKKI